MDSDSSGFVTTTYSVDEEIEDHLRRLNDERKQRKYIMQNERKKIFENLRKNFCSDNPFHLEGMHLYTFNHLKIKFGFNPSEVAHVTRRIKFVCVLRYTGRFWTLGRNTIPANWKFRIYNIFLQEESIKDNYLPNAIDNIHSIFLEWSIEHEKFRRNKIQKYKSGQIEFFDLDSEDEELYLSQAEIRDLKERRERILKRMIPPKRKKQPKENVPHEDRLTKFSSDMEEITPTKRRKRRTGSTAYEKKLAQFSSSPNIHLYSD